MRRLKKALAPGAAAQPLAPAAGPGSTPRPVVKRLNSKPVVIAGAALLFVVLAVVFLATSRPKAGEAPAAGFQAGAPDAPATAEFLNTDPASPPPPGPDCQGLGCAAAVAAGQAIPGVTPADSLALPPAVAVSPYGRMDAPAPSGAVAAYPATDPYAVTYAPAVAEPPAAAPSAPECDRSCRYRAARAARLSGDATGGAAAPAPAQPRTAQFQPGPDGLMPDAYYDAIADSMFKAELAGLGGALRAAREGDSGRNDDGDRLRQPAAPAPAGRGQAAPSSPYVVSAGTVIPAALVTGINSDLCGDVKAVVTRNVYDARQRLVLIPAGTELLGRCGDQVAAGQARLAVAWTALRFPEGRTLALPGLPTHSRDGASGVRDRVNNHWGRVFGTAVLLSAVGAGVQLGIPQESEGGSLSPAQTAATAAAAELSTLATEVLRRNLEVKPTIEIREATPFVVFVAADLDVGAPAPRPRSGGARW